MTKQPEALRLAEILDADPHAHHEEASAELRRLHTENARLFNAIEDSLKNYARVLRERHEFHEVNQELLEALKCIVDVNPRLWDEDVRDQFEPWAKNRARAAIAKAEGQNVRGGPALYTTIHSGEQA